MTFYVYLIGSRDKKKTISYVGYTNNLKKRIILHNNSKGAKFTKGRKWKLIYYKKYKNKIDAMKNEYRLKNNYSLRKKLKNIFYENINSITF